jgi:hypothetical protein
MPTNVPLFCSHIRRINAEKRMLVNGVIPGASQEACGVDTRQPAAVPVDPVQGRDLVQRLPDEVPGELVAGTEDPDAAVTAGQLRRRWK